MGLQLIIVVETNPKCKSDWIYIKDTIDSFYEYDMSNVKIRPVYMGGKYKYEDKLSEIRNYTNAYAKVSKDNKTKVIYCFDCDDYDIEPDDDGFLNTVNKFCDDNGYDLVWFCKDIERVYLGKKVADKEKKAESARFKAKNLISGVNVKKLAEKKYKQGCSNIMNVLDKYLMRKSDNY